MSSEEEEEKVIITNTQVRAAKSRIMVPVVIFALSVLVPLLFFMAQLFPFMVPVRVTTSPGRSLPRLPAPGPLFLVWEP